MKQVIQNYRTGKLELAETPIPLCSSNSILVRNAASLVSIGTERSVIELAQKSLLGKAKARPDLMKQFMNKAKKQGFSKTFQEALNRLDNPTPLGYSSAGVVVEAGVNVHKFSPGDRVACIGAGYASHAEYICVPENLCCRMPDNLTFEEASFGMLGIIALHGIRCANLTFGASVAVIGFGLLGLLTVQILRAYGCKVIGTDIDPVKRKLAVKIGADVVTEVSQLKARSDLFTGGWGVDAVILTVATESDEPVNTAVDIAKQGGKIVVVGVADIHPHRNEMWHKEVEIIVSKAGGAGTFDPLYENKGIDYPFGYVRWTEHRNLEEFVRLMSTGKVDVKPLISHRFKIEQAEDVYRNIMKAKNVPYIGVVLNYPEEPYSLENEITYIGKRKIIVQPTIQASSEISLGVIGAGLFGKAIFLPALKKIPGIRFDTIATSSSANTYHTAKKYGFEKCTTDYREVLNNNDINSVLILTPHSLHAKMVVEAMQAGKHIFVEKPLCITQDELDEIISLYNPKMPFLMIGYNRRFSPHSMKIKEFLQDRKDPAVIHCRINPGYVAPDHWVHSEEEGGSRIIGEVCHFVDMLQFLTESNPVKVYAERISGNNRTTVNSDNVAVVLKFEDGSVGNIVYSASGDKAFSREYLEVFFEGKVGIVKDFKETVLYADGRKKTFKTVNQEIGYKEELQHFFDTVKGRSLPVLSPEEIFLSTLTTFKINESLTTGKPAAFALQGL